MLEKEIINKYKELNSTSAVAKHYGVGTEAICRVLAKNNILDFLQLNQKIIDIVVEMYIGNKTVKEISTFLEIGQKQVTYVLLSKNIMRKRTSKYAKNESIFEIIDTEEKAYWLGFLYADGYVGNVTNLELALQELDYDHILKFKEFIGSNCDIKKKTTKLNGKIYNSYRLTVCSKKIIEDLSSLGCTNKKSLTLTFPTENIVPKHLVHHFIRGYTDGDGCITTGGGSRCKQLSYKLEGTESFLKRVAEIFEDNINVKIISLNKSNRGKQWTMCATGNIKAKIILDYLYKDSNIYLKRKKDKFAVLTQKLQKS